MRVPRITGFPSMTVGLISIRSCTETWMPLRCAELLPTVSSEAGRRPLLGGHSSQVAVADTAMISRSSDDRSGDMTVIWQPALSEEAERWRGVAERVTHKHFAPLADELDRAQRHPWEDVRRLVEHDLAGLFIPKEHGGQGASLAATVAVVETIGIGC